MEQGGTLRVTAEMSRTDGSEKVQIRFSDTGHGIPAANYERIFEPFFTTKEHVGTGLGLWVAKRIVADHQGELLVESDRDANRGTTFTVVLPHENVMGAANIG
jgi:signal transduction histidine kinase